MVQNTRLEIVKLSPHHADAYEIAAMAQELLNLRPRTTPPAAAPPPASPVLDLSKPVQTRDGRKVTLLFTNGRGSFSLGGYIDDTDELRTWRVTGSFLNSSTRDHDLVNIAEKIELTRWVNIYKEGSVLVSYPHADREKARRAAGSHRTRFACVEVKISATEGEGL